MGPFDEEQQVLPAEEDDGDVCRICRSPEGPENPLRYPCACRGSIKYVHQECLLLWLNRRGYKQCEVCKRSYSFVPVYAENAPERLSRIKFLKGLSVRALRFFTWISVLLFNTYCFALHPWGQSAAVENQNVFRVNWMFASLMAGFVYNGFIVYIMTMIMLLRQIVERIVEFHRRVIREEVIGNNDIRGHGLVAGCAIALWKYMSILTDWWHDLLLCNRICHAIMLEMGEALILPRNAQLQEFGAVRRFFSLLSDNLFAVLAISTYVSFFFILLPFSLGNLMLGLLHLLPRTEKLPTDSLGQEMVEASFVYSNSPCINGYMILMSLYLAYLGSFLNLHLDIIQAIAKMLPVGFLFIPYLLWFLSREVWRNLYLVRHAVILCLKLGVSPLLLGIWLDLCIFPLSGTTISRRLEILSEYPFVMMLHWMFGCICMTCTFSFMEFMQKIIQKRAFRFLLDVTDPDYKIAKLHLGQTLFALAFHGTLMVTAVHLPIKTISFISPSFFPLQFWIFEERLMLASIPAYILLVRVGVLELLVKLITPALEPTIHKWVITVSSWLQLTTFLLKNHEDQNMRPLLQEPLQIIDQWIPMYSIAEGSVVTFYGIYGTQSYTIEEEDTEVDRFIIVRIGLMFVLAILSLFLISTVSMSLPILMGRLFFHSISPIMLRFNLQHDDLYGFFIGCYILRVIYISICFIANHIKMGRTDLLLSFVLLWIRNAILFSIWISIIPALLGVLIDLMIIIPSRVPLNKSLLYYLLQDWLIGSVFLHIWTFLTMFTRVKCFSTLAWREKLEMIRSVGINHLPFTWLAVQVIGSIGGTLLAILGYPLVVAYHLFPLLGFSGAVNSAVQRLIWPVILAMVILGFVAKLTINLFMYIHRVEYDDQYLVGTRVSDFTEIV